MKAIPRFDVFVEYTRRERLGAGAADDEAKGYGIWLAKVVPAARQQAGGSRRVHDAFGG